jgi:transposase
MIWASFSGASGRSDLAIMKRDPDAPRGGYSANSYLDMLEEYMLPDYEPGQIFMQDNARIHTAHICQEFFIDHGVHVMEWPPYSPDLNPIEHLWFELKKELKKRFPETDDWDLGKAEVRARMEDILPECWEGIDHQYFFARWQSMPNRIAAVIKAKGWHTKY